jgi:3-hydroxyisobutyrate dehydrogenase-like beta-hydroxyacid dehydrogenase
MKKISVGILSPGDMGSAIGKVLVDAGYPVLTAMDGRSDLTKLRAREANISDLGTIDKLVAASDLIVSVLVPS